MHKERMAVPLRLAKGGLVLLPARRLDGALQALMHRLESRHPRLFRNLSRLDPAVVKFSPTDLPHIFSLSFGGGQKAVFSLGEPAAPTAHVKGRLADLLEMLEGKTDGDMLFFTRSLIVEGATATIVGLRNTLDRENLDLMGDILSFFGPFARPAGLAVRLAEGVLQKLEERAAAFHSGLHESFDKGAVR